MPDEGESPQSGRSSIPTGTSAPRFAGLRRTAGSVREAAERNFEHARHKRGIREAVEALISEQRSGATLLAGGLAYRFFLWLVPFGLVVAAIASFWVRSSPTSLEDAAKSFGLGGVAARSAIGAVEDGSRARWYLLLTGVLVIAWAGIGAVRALRVAARLAWRLDPERLRHPLRASGIFAAVCVAGLGASIAASWARHKLAMLGLAVTLGDVLVYALLALYAFSHLPRPNDVTRRALWPGAVLVGVGITGVHVLLAYFLAAKLERSPSLYGALGASTVVLLVLFLIARLIVSAMFLNAALQRLHNDLDPGPAEGGPGSGTPQTSPVSIRKQPSVPAPGDARGRIETDEVSHQTRALGVGRSRP